MKRALGISDITEKLRSLPGWELESKGASHQIAKNFEFSNFLDVMAFANAIARLAERANHHPEITLSYKHCQVRWQTHDAHGITQLDFDCAAQVNALLGPTLDLQPSP